jgi:hypothetical protein
LFGPPVCHGRVASLTLLEGEFFEIERDYRNTVPYERVREAACRGGIEYAEASRTTRLEVMRRADNHREKILEERGIFQEVLT